MQTLKESAPMKGTVRVKRYRGGTLDSVIPLYRRARIVQLLAFSFLPGIVRDFVERRLEAIKAQAQAILDAGFIELAVEQKNLIVTSSSGYGKNLVARRLGGDNTYTLNISHGEIGTGSTSPATSDTALTTPTLRAAITSADISNNVVTCHFFYTDALLANGTYNEFGTFIDGTSTIGTGRMWNHALFGSPYIKSAGQDTTVDVEIDVN